MMEGFGETMTHDQLRKHLKIGKSTLYKMAREGKIPPVKIEQRNNKKVIIRVPYNQKLFGHNVSKTTEIYTHVSKASIASIKNPLAIVLRKKTMSAPRRKYIRETTYIPTKWKDILNADMNELSEMPNTVLLKRRDKYLIKLRESGE